jgi:hypothetical protein
MPSRVSQCGYELLEAVATGGWHLPSLLIKPEAEQPGNPPDGYSSAALDWVFSGWGFLRSIP